MTHESVSPGRPPVAANSAARAKPSKSGGPTGSDLVDTTADVESIVFVEPHTRRDVNYRAVERRRSQSFAVFQAVEQPDRGATCGGQFLAGHRA
jgi:hypothetical protein